MRAARIVLATLACVFALVACSSEVPSSNGRTASGFLDKNATCDDYMTATKEQRQTATRAALIVAREAAGGVDREPPEMTRAVFEVAVGLTCDKNRSERMLTAMAKVIAEDDRYVN